MVWLERSRIRNTLERWKNRCNSFRPATSRANNSRDQTGSICGGRQTFRTRRCDPAKWRDHKEPATERHDGCNLPDGFTSQTIDAPKHPAIGSARCDLSKIFCNQYGCSEAGCRGLLDPVSP